MLVRAVISFALALAVTLGLFYLMHKLIELGRVDLGDEDKVRVIDFVRLRHEEKVQTKKRELPQKQELKSQPAPPSMNLPKSAPGFTGAPIKIAAPAPQVERKVRLAGGPSLSSAPSDTSSIPLVRIQPMYPRQAAEKRIEGWVQLEFTISTKGTVKNARVLSSQPPRIFDKAALQAIRKWKYKPTIKDGVAIETPGVQVKLTFKLDN